MMPRRTKLWMSSSVNVQINDLGYSRFFLQFSSDHIKIRRIIFSFWQETVEGEHLRAPPDPLVQDPLVTVKNRTTEVLHPKTMENFTFDYFSYFFCNLSSVLASVLFKFQNSKSPARGSKNNPSFGNTVNPPEARLDK